MCVVSVNGLDSCYNVLEAVCVHFIKSGILFFCLFEMIVLAYPLFLLEDGNVQTVQKEKYTKEVYDLSIASLFSL